MSGLWFVLGLTLAVLAVGACFYAWIWAVRTSFCARVAVAEAEQARKAHEVAAELLAAERSKMMMAKRAYDEMCGAEDAEQLAPLPRPPWPAASKPDLRVLPPRRCAMCGSDQEPLEPEFIGSADSKTAVLYCRDSDQCTIRARKAVLKS